MTSTEQSLTNEMLKDGLDPAEPIIADGVFRRIDDKNGKKGNKLIGYICNKYGGYYNHWSKLPDGKNWSCIVDNDLSENELHEWKAFIQNAKVEKEKADAELRKQCREKSTIILDTAKEADSDHPYLVKKGVEAHGIKIHNGNLVIPVLDVDGTLNGLQWITAKGDKWFELGTAIKGHFGKLSGDSDKPLYVAEGFATSATIHEATGATVIIAFSAGNLKPVAEAMRKANPTKIIVLCADNDQWTNGNPGLTKATEAAKAINAILAVPSSVQALPEGERPTDYNDYAKLFSLDFVKAILSKAVSKSAPGSRIKVVTALELMTKAFPPRVYFLDPWLSMQGLAMIYAFRGVGKTQVSMECAYALASGGSFLGWQAPAPVNVLFIDGEMPATVLQERLAQIAASSSHKQTASLKFITPDEQDPSIGMLDLSRPADQAELEPHLDGVQVIIIDNLSTLCRTGKENEGESWLLVQEWCLRQRAAGRSVLIIHHAGKNGEQRGSSRREDVLDTVICLKRPGDYTPDQGATFEVHFEKARGLVGDCVAPFLAKLTTDFEGNRVWVKESLEKSTAEKVAALLNEGIPQHEIPDLLKLTKGAVSKAKKKAAGMGLLKGPKV